LVKAPTPSRAGTIHGNWEADVALKLAHPIRDPEKDVIEAGATRITTLSAVVGGLAGIDVAFNHSLVKIFGGTPSNGVKTTILVALIAAWALIAVADLLARAIATAASQPRLAIPPAGTRVRRPDLEGETAEKQWLVAATEFDPNKPDATRLLVLKAGEQPVWVDASTVKGE
jgi:hypothetical protein